MTANCTLPTGSCNFVIFEKFTRAYLHQIALEIVLYICSCYIYVHINYARKLDHYASDRHQWHLAENYAEVFLSVQFDNLK